MSVNPKGQMVRIVRTPQGTVELDETGKRSGRGAYLCRNWECWEQGLKKGQLARTLKISILPKYVKRLWEYAEGLKLESGALSE